MDNGNPLQYSCLENPTDGGAWWAAVHGGPKSRIRLSDFAFTFHFHALEKEIATHSSVLAWRIPGTGEPGGLLSMGSHRVGHDWSNLAAAAATSGRGDGEVNVTQPCLTLCNPMDCTVHGILQARILEWCSPEAVSFSRGSSQPKDQIQISCIARGFLTSWATREALEGMEGAK